MHSPVVSLHSVLLCRCGIIYYYPLYLLFLHMLKLTKKMIRSTKSIDGANRNSDPRPPVSGTAAGLKTRNTGSDSPPVAPKACRVAIGRMTSPDDPASTRFGGSFYTYNSRWGPAVVGRRDSVRLNGEGAQERQIEKLPAFASDVYPDADTFGWTPRLKTILLGVLDAGSPLGLLAGLEDQLVRRIFSNLTSEFAQRVTLTLPATCVARIGDRICRYKVGRPERHNTYETIEGMVHVSEDDMTQGCVSFASCGSIDFPDPAGRNVNMLPFILGDKHSLPGDLQCYYSSAIEKCPFGDGDIGKVAYLTVHESYVQPGSAQRRGGLHIETPGLIAQDDNPAFSPGSEHRWGMGVFFSPDRYEGGIFMASNIADTSEVWDALVDKKVKGIVDKHGGCEHLRPLIGPGTKLKANELIWMTDCTPHEALPQKETGHRQFFRLVTPNISHWFADHCTPNPKVPLPGHVVIVRGNKFDG
mmetsp:Transcript_41448/g.125510  ORF Transcript_41448/g.125510 Transcript_41448/m.125510 type:complete len:472 (-) Transcript_41448:336-1751(-)